MSGAGADDPVLIDAADRAVLMAALRPLTPSSLQAQSSPKRKTPTLTAKEREILSLLATGIANRSIAEAMMVSVETIKWHLKNIFNKLGVHDREHVIGKGCTSSHSRVESIPPGKGGARRRPKVLSRLSVTPLTGQTQ